MTDNPWLEPSKTLGTLLRRKGFYLVTAESCTGGGFGQAITSAPGSSAWYWGGVVTYSNAAKTRLLKVPAHLIEQYGAVSKPVARHMALGAIALSQTQCAIAITGLAGPGGDASQQPVGTLWFAFALGETVNCTRHLFTGTRADIRRQAIQSAFEGLFQQLK